MTVEIPKVSSSGASFKTLEASNLPPSVRAPFQTDTLQSLESCCLKAEQHGGSNCLVVLLNSIWNCVVSLFEMLCGCEKYKDREEPAEKEIHRCVLGEDVYVHRADTFNTWR